MDQNILEYGTDTVQYLRKQYDLDEPGRLEEAIEILLDWLKKQEHIVRKSYSKVYLERTIIISKGSVERAKVKLDKIATFRTLLPGFFEPIPDLSKLRILDILISGFLPKMTEDHYRVFLIKGKGKQIDTGYTEYIKYLVMICEYLQANDYCNGILIVFDYRDINIYEIIKAINVVELQQTLGIIMEGYRMRLKGIHYITTSKAVDALITVFKQALSAKVAKRIYVHKTVEDIYKYIPSKIMPSDYGGQAKTIIELSNDLKKAIGSPQFMEYVKEMQKACTNENYRRDDKFNEQYLGMPGSFRKLNVD